MDHSPNPEQRRAKVLQAIKSTARDATAVLVHALMDRDPLVRTLHRPYVDAGLHRMRAGDQETPQR